MSVTYLPGAPQFGQGGGGADSQGLVQLAMAVKSFKMQEREQKRQEAQQKAQILMSNPALLVMTDPKDVEKALKEGYGLNFTDQSPADPAKATQVPTGGGTPPSPSSGGPSGAPKADPNSIAQLC